jgi:hypothetical protein
MIAISLLGYGECKIKVVLICKKCEQKEKIEQYHLQQHVIFETSHCTTIS